MEAHFVNVGLVRVSPDGTLYNASDTTKAIKETLQFDSGHRILPDASIPSSIDYPTIQEYLNREAVLGFQPVQVAQYFVVTAKIT